MIKKRKESKPLKNKANPNNALILMSLILGIPYKNHKNRSAYLMALDNKKRINLKNLSQAFNRIKNIKKL